MSGVATSAPTVRRWTDAQAAAIGARGRTLVAAAAGSGKTSVLVELVTSALVAREFAPSEICAVTFTEKAAQEMRGRIARRLEGLGEHDLLAQLELARIGTIHGLCSTILRRHGASIGVDPGAGVLDEAQHAWLLRESREQALLMHGADPDVQWLRVRIGDDRLAELLDRIRRLDASGEEPAPLAPLDAADLPRNARTGEPTITPEEARRCRRAIDVLRTTWEDILLGRRRELGRLTFDDLEALAVRAVRLPEVRAALRARWTCVLVDEFQDTNERQFELLEAIGADRLFMVGDEWQSIYRFRGADVDVFRARRAASDTGVVQMRENFRSTAPVLDVVNRVFGHETLFGERYEPVLAGTDVQRAARAPAVELLVVPTEHDEASACPPDADGRTREAMRVAQRVAELVESGTAHPGEIAILSARRTGDDVYEDALRAWGIPVVRAAADGYYDQRDVRDVLAVLGVLRNARDEHAALSVLAGPLGQLRWEQLDAVVTAARSVPGAGRGSADLIAAASTSDVAAAREVARVVAELRTVAAGAPLVDVVARVVALPAFELGAARESDGLVRLANLRRLVDLAASAEAVGVGDLSGFLEFVAAQRRDARVGEANVADETFGGGAVRMMTIHASKGLEFPWVFVVEAGATETMTQSVPDPVVDADGRLHVPLPGPDGRFGRTEPLVELAAPHDAAAREERQRLWYVAMTRAMRGLVISGRWSFEPKQDGGPRAVGGALAWLRSALDAGERFGGAGRTALLLDGLVRLDTRPADRVPEHVHEAGVVELALAPALPLPSVAAADADASVGAGPPDPRALRTALREAVEDAGRSEWRQLDGTRVHDAVARLLDAARAGTPEHELLDPEHGPWLTDAVRERLTPVVASSAFRALARLRARTEVPYVLGRGDVVPSRAAPGVAVASSSADVDAGRIDALAVDPADGSWWIVDWKTTLPADPQLAWHDHGEQLRRYARVAHAGGATSVHLTLVPLDRPDDAHTWGIDREGAVVGPVDGPFPPRR